LSKKILTKILAIANAPIIEVFSFFIKMKKGNPKQIAPDNF